MDPQVIDAVKRYRKFFKSEPEYGAFAPGRANLIGEHTDYNEGFVLPFALPYKTVIVGSKTTDGKTTVISSAQELQNCTFEINSSLKPGEPEWANYVKGAVYQYLGEIPKGFGFNACIVSNVPLGSGLSSSAALEVAVATFVEALLDLKIEKVEKALRCQKAEHTFANTPCGIMDQFISAMGEEKNLLLIDCRTNKSTLVPFGGGDPNDPVILVTNSNVKHSLSGSEYPDRVRQCKEAVAVCQKKSPEIKSLRDASLEILEKSKKKLDALAYKRAKHVITEDIRTKSTVEALKKKDFAAVGKYMNESHDSLQTDYEVSCKELDLLVKLAREVEGVLGSRMTGGGFGGCTVTLVEQASVDKLMKHLTENYTKETGTKCDCYVAYPAAGSKIIELPKYVTQVQGEDVQGLTGLTGSWLTWAIPTAVTVIAAVVVAVHFTQKKH